MTVVRDSFTERSTFTTATPATSSYTPVGTLRSVTVFIGHGTESTDLINGAVTYGGVALTRVATNGFAQDTAGEPGAIYAYHLGASIPTGVQTVSISHTGSSTVKWALIVGHTAAGDTEVVTSGKLEGDQANPQLALDTGAVSSIRCCGLYSGQDAAASVVALTGMEAITGANSHDFGAFTAFVGQQSTAASGSFTIGFTATSEDVAFTALAIQEVAGPATVTPAAVAATATLPTPTPSVPSTVLPAVLLAVASLFTPTLTAASTVTPVTVARTVALPTPTIPGPPTLVRDSFSERTTFTTTNPVTSSHTPVGVPRSVTVFIGHGTSSSDLITGAVTYGGVAMTRVPTNGFAQDTAGEPGAVYAYHLGAGIPTGTQTLSIGHSGASSTKWAIVVYHTAAANTEIVTSGKLEDDQANPQLALDTGSTSSIRCCVLYSGVDSLVGVNAITGMETVGVSSSVDFGAFLAVMGQQSVASAGSFTIGFDVASDDVAFIAVAIQEVAGGTSVVPVTFTAAATLPTPTVGIPALRTPATVAAVASLPTPTLPRTVTPASVVVAVTVPTASVFTGITVTPATIGGYSDIYGDIHGAEPYATLPTPSILAAVRKNPTLISRAVIFGVPTVIGGSSALRTPATVTATATLPVAAIRAAATVTPATIATVATVPTPSALVVISVTPTTITSTVTLPTPTTAVGSTSVVTPATVTVTATLPSPTMVTAVRETPAAISRAVIFGAVIVRAASTVTPDTVTATATLPTPTLTGSVVVTPAVIPVTAVPLEPSLLIGVGALVVPETVAVTATPLTPLISTPISVTSATVLTVVTVPTPTATGGVAGSVTPATVTATATLDAATLNVEATVTPADVPVTTTVPTPTVGLDGIATPAIVGVTVTLPTPALLAGTVIVPPTVAVIVDLPIPDLVGETAVEPLTVEVFATLPTPNVVVGAIFPPGFWSPDPVGYVSNPVGYVPIGPDDTPPWN